MNVVGAMLVVGFFVAPLLVLAAAAYLVWQPVLDGEGHVVGGR